MALTVTACGGNAVEENSEEAQKSAVTEAASDEPGQVDASSFVEENSDNAEGAVGNTQNLPEEMEEGEAAMAYYDFTEAGIAGKLPDTKVSLEAERAGNEDACSYIVIPGTNISSVVLKKSDSNEYYLDHSADGQSSSTGSIFMDMGNATDFTDPVTCLYAKSGEGAPFSELTEFFDPEFVKNNEFIYVYSDDYVSEYRVFAAYNTDDTERLLVKYNFYDYTDYQNYLSEVFSNRDMTAVLNPELQDAAVNVWNIITLIGINDDGSRQMVQAVFSGRTTY